MAVISQEQLIHLVRSLEAKVKEYQAALQDKDKEIYRLKTELVKYLREDRSRSPVVPSPVPKPAATMPSGPPPAAVPGKPASEPTVAKPVLPAVAPKAPPLEERTPTFIKKAAPGVSETIKAAVRGPAKEAPIESGPPPPPIPDEESTESPDLPDIENAAEEPLPEWAQPEIPPLPAVNFKAGEFLGAVLEGEEEAEDVKRHLQKLEDPNPEQRRSTLLSLTGLHWRMIGNMTKRLLQGGLPWEKRLFMRFGMLDESLMSDRMDIWNALYLDKSRPEDSGIYYIDEWFEAVIRGDYKYSAIDEMALGGAKPDPNATGALALKYEALNVPQMQRMCVGARANLVSVLLQDYCAPGRDNPVVTRQWLQTTMTQMRKFDTLMFYRKYKGEEVHVQPLFIITPGYGQKAGCWEPYTPGKKGSSGPRICLCAFPPRSSYRALLMGLADYRWEYAKADAMHYWLCEGLTGKWLALFGRKEQRRDMKQVFVECYYHWAMNESRRIPKLEKRFRDFFWINVPFSDEVKQTLKSGGTYARLVELEEAKKKREEEERVEIERIKAEREARKAARLAKPQDPQ